MNRRAFLKVSSATGAALLVTGRPVPEGAQERGGPSGAADERWVPNVCLQCPAACGILVKVVDGRAVKIEGNPVHPINEGRLCPKGHIGLQLLYDPDRIKGPLKRVGERGEGKWETIGWDQAIGIVAKRLGELRGRGEPHTVVFMGGRYRGQMHALFGRFMQAYGTPNDVGHSSICADGSPIAHYLTQGIKSYLGYDWDNTNYILCFGGSFLEAWRPTTRLLRAYGHIRRERPVRGKLVHVDTRFSVTAAKADEWLAIRPGTDGALALGIAHVIVAEELYDKAFVAEHTFGFDDWVDDKTGAPHTGFKRLVLQDYPPPQVAEITGIPEATIVRIAREFAATRPAVAAGERGSSMQANGIFNRMAIHSLNALVGSIDAPGGVIVQRGPHFSDWPKLEPDPVAKAGLGMPRVDHAGTARFPLAGKVYQHMPEIFAGAGPYPVKALFLYYTNPLFSSPDIGRFYETIKRVPFIVDFTPFMSETAEYADLILPDHTYLERWQDDVIYPSLGYPVVGLRQPVVKPLYDTMNTGDALIKIARRMGGSVAQAFPWKNMEEVLKFRFKRIWEEGEGNLKAGSFEEFWAKLGREGVWYKKGYAFGEWDKVLRTPSKKFEFYSIALKKKLDELALKEVEKAREGGKESTPDAELEKILKGLKLTARGDGLYLPHYEPIRHVGDPKRYPLLLNTYKLITHAEGRGANAPWMLERLGVHVKQRWESWAELNPDTARELGIRDGDLIWIESSVGKLRTNAKLYPGARPDVVNIPFTLGHRAYGRYAKGRGANPNWILANEYDYLGGTAAFFSTRVRVSRA
ncbi:MAG: molybdopterin-dependent oxidoreductase [Candidatus Rokubacteria bacterium]|nr:molybdopterin-dependent oxidoreductase [Candidatus Rokubacteria bacterium]